MIACSHRKMEHLPHPHHIVEVRVKVTIQTPLHIDYLHHTSIHIDLHRLASGFGLNIEYWY
jgi:hypothetical protein